MKQILFTVMLLSLLTLSAGCGGSKAPTNQPVATTFQPSPQNLPTPPKGGNPVAPTKK